MPPICRRATRHRRRPSRQPSCFGALGFADRSNAIFAPTNGVLARHTSHGGSFTGGVLAGYDWHVGPVVFGPRGDPLGAHAVNAGMEPAKRKMRSRDLAAQIGIAEQNVSLLKSGKVKGVRFDTLEKICEILRC